jgi:hypothetical protein
MTAVAITGMHRAGTSMVANAMSRAGAYLGPQSRMLPPAPDNPEGFFEHAAFVRLADDLLEACGGAWDHLPEAPPFGSDDPRVQPFVVAAQSLVQELDGAQTWAWKDPRTCLTAAMWRDLVPGLRVVICVRNPLDVAVSLRRRNGTSYLHALNLWRGYYTSVLDAAPEADRIVTHYDAHLADPVAELARLTAFAELPDQPHAEVADRGRRHHRIDVALSDAGVGADVIALYERLCAEAGYSVSAPPMAPIAVDRRTIDLALAHQSLERYGRYVTGLQKDLDQYANRVAELEAAGRGAVLADVTARLDALEDAQHDNRYGVEDLSGHPEAAAVLAARALVRSHVPRGDQVLVAGEADAAMLDVYGRPAVAFPTPLDDELSDIARLEASRLLGARYLLAPRPALDWLDQRPCFADHLLGSYGVVAEGHGLLVDVGARRPAAGEWPASVSVTIERLFPGSSADPAILDWTAQGLARHLPGRNVFTPPDDSSTLPYLEGSVEIIVVDDPGRLPEARRVAARAVIALTGGSCPVVQDVDLLDDVAPEPPPTIRYLVAADSEPSWQTLFAEDVGDAVDVVSGPLEAAELAAGADLIGIVEPGVLPLPGCAAAAVSAMASERAGGVAVKLLAADGTLEAAGETVFADGSFASIASGSAVVSDPWHEYVRDVCGGLGLLYVSAAVLGKLGDQAVTTLEPHPMVWSAAIWRAGLRVRYQPSAVAVRATPPEGSDLLDGAIRAAWAPALAYRPDRPAPLDAPAWRRLLAADDIEGAWR